VSDYIHKFTPNLYLTRLFTARFHNKFGTFVDNVDASNLLCACMDSIRVSLKKKDFIRSLFQFHNEELFVRA